MRIFAVVNQKGGCGKTTTAINLAGVFAGRGYRTLLVDMDPQGHCAAGLAIPEQRVDLHIGDAMLAADDAPVDPARLLWRVSRNLDLAPSTVRLAALEAARGELAGRADAESRLKRVLSRFDGQYDVGLIDCSPAIGLLAFNALVAAHEVLIPVETGFFSLQGATKQINAIKAVGKRLGVSTTHRLLATMHDPSSVLSQDLLDELRRRFGGRVLPTVIRQDQALREAASFGQPVVEYSPDSNGAKDYSALADWLIENAVKNGGRKTGESDDDGGVQVVPGVGERTMAAFAPAKAAAVFAPAGGGSPVAVSPSPPPTSPTPPTPTTTTIPSTYPAHPSSPVSGPVHAAQSAAPAAAPAAAPVAAPVAVAVVNSIGERDGLAAVMVPVVQASTTGLAAMAAVAAGGSGLAVAEPARALTSRAADVASRTRRLQRAALVMSPDAGAAGAKPAAKEPEPVTATPAARVEAAARPFGVLLSGRSVVFSQPASIGQSVAIAGEFNGWSPAHTPMRLNALSGQLEAIVEIKPGRSQYRLVVDGRWMPDPFNPVVAPNPFGGSDSVVIVPEHTAEGSDMRSIG